MSESADDRQCCRKHGEGELDHSGFAADSSRLWSLHGVTWLALDRRLADDSVSARKSELMVWPTVESVCDGELGVVDCTA